jgi:peptide/nickel transport system ATP-binding protein
MSAEPSHQGAPVQPPLLEVRNVTKTYGGRAFLQTTAVTVALQDFSLTLAADQPRIVAIAGESGSGKTTAARLVLGFHTPTIGEIVYRGKSLAAMSAEESRTYRREVQAVMQDPYEVYNPFYKVDHVFNVVVRKFKLASSADQARRMIEVALEFVGLRPAETLGRYPHQLSGGQRQRIMIARAFLLQPKLIVADEPVSMVDASIRSMILEIMLRLKQDMGVSFLYITHDLSTAYEVSDDILILYRGRVVEQGNAQQVIENPQHAYTRLLINSIPIPDPDVRWQGRLELPEDLVAE